MAEALALSPADVSAAVAEDPFLGIFAPTEKVTPEQLQKIAQLGEKVAAIEATLSRNQKRHFAEHRSHFCARHLIGRKWSVDDAFKMIQAIAKWRNENKLDEMALFPDPLVYVRGYDMNELIKIRGCGERQKDPRLDEATRQLRKTYAAGWHYYTKMGHPVYYERTGHGKVRELVERMKSLTLPGQNAGQLVTDLHVVSNRVGETLVEYCNQKGIAKKPVAKVVVIMDMAGLSMDHLYPPALELMKGNSEVDQNLESPEGLEALYAVNCGLPVRAGWQIVRLWLDARIQNKVHFIDSANTPARLKEIIAEEHLPTWLGGKCECSSSEGGCIPDTVGPADAAAAAAAGGGSGAGADMGPTKAITVKAGSSETIVTRITAPGSKVKLNFHCDAHDVIYGAKFEVPAGEEGAAGAQQPAVIREPAKISGTHEMEVTSPSSPNAKLVVTFDNTFSWMKSKSVAFRADVTPPASPQ